MAVSTFCLHRLHIVSLKAIAGNAKAGTNYSMDFVRQVAALPFRREGDGSPRVLLVTSRHTRRWIIPKGWPQAGCDDHHAAAAEARDEAGILGVVLPSSIGCYTYRKQLRNGSVDVRVTVFLLSITEELTSWLECEQRQRAWFTPADAAALVEEPELQDLLHHIGTWSADWPSPSLLSEKRSP
ncbi:NUDIX hydrolase [Bradyrhizobium sp.]|uniref:NUDIX hydrolase n=1 Tax=Bradyrhizobium sp. TaxID=376 RepID=UPI003C749817